jgi:hypothetical protein
MHDGLSKSTSIGNGLAPALFQACLTPFYWWRGLRSGRLALPYLIIIHSCSCAGISYIVTRRFNDF